MYAMYKLGFSEEEWTRRLSACKDVGFYLGYELSGKSYEEYQKELESAGPGEAQFRVIEEKDRRTNGLVKTFTDTRGQFQFRLKKGKYLILAKGEVGTTYHSNWKREAERGAALWVHVLDLRSDTHVVLKEMFCDPNNKMF